MIPRANHNTHRTTFVIISRTGCCRAAKSTRITTDLNEHVCAVDIMQFTVVIPRTRTNMFLQYIYHTIYGRDTTDQNEHVCTVYSVQSQDRCTRGQQFAGQLFFFLQPKSTAPARRTRRSRSRRQFYHLNAVKHWSARPRVCAPLTRRSARRPCFRPHCEILQFVANETKKPLFSSSP